MQVEEFKSISIYWYHFLPSPSKMEESHTPAMPAHSSINSKPRTILIVHLRSFDAHLHQAIVGIHHSLKPNSLRTSIGLLPIPIAGWAAAPWLKISLHRTLHDRTIMYTHAWRDSTTLKACGVEVVVSSALIVDLPCDFFSRRSRLWLRSRRS